MKNKDTQALEEAYSKTRLMKEENAEAYTEQEVRSSLVITPEDVTKYNEMHAAFSAGKISIGQWEGFCKDFLNKLMDGNKDVLQRLKDR